MTNGVTVALDFSDFLETLRDQPTPQAKLAYAFQKGPGVAWPDLEQVRAFLALFHDTLHAEPRPHEPTRQSRLDGIQLIRDYIGRGGPSPAQSQWFPTIRTPEIFAFQLALRLRWPELIDQEQTNLCGVAAAMSQYGREDPRGLAELGIGLLTKGWGRFRQLRVSPLDESLKTLTWRSGRPADQVLLGGFGAATGKEIFREGVAAQVVAAWLRAAGYHPVDDVSFELARTTPSKRRPLVEDAITAVQARRLVVFGTTGRLVEALQTGRVETLTNRRRETAGTTPHWVGLHHLAVDGDLYSISLSSWGHSIAGEVEADTLLTHYNGHVAATPPTGTADAIATPTG